MHRCYHHTCGDYPPRPQNPGLADLAGGMINLALTALYGGSHVIHRVVNGVAWGCCDHRDECGCHAHHRVECRPQSCEFRYYQF
jgi:hypothetical protein